MGIDWMVEDTLDGRISAGKSRKGTLPDTATLKLAGERIYQLQNYLEDLIRKGGDFFTVRWLVLMNEDLRKAVIEFNAEQRTP